MRPILMKGHERPLTFLKYNREGDLLFSCAKDHNPTVWFADNGERLGTYRGHNGAVWCCDVSRDSRLLITGSADQSVKLWDIQSGTQLYSFNFEAPARAVEFSVGDKLAVITTDPFMEQTPTIQVKRIARDPNDQVGETVLTIKGPQGRINRAVWGPLNKTIISAGEDAVVRIWDSEVVIGGGQDASAVTRTDHRAGKFEAKFFHKILQEEIGGVKGHFGPINALAFNPDGRRPNFFGKYHDENIKLILPVSPPLCRRLTLPPPACPLPKAACCTSSSHRGATASPANSLQ
ncbi:Eukaryotic translation initiation factor 3 subunit I [Platanthera guangdongensis]|uniref:Serine-threonine kinase receptor-associated protein n=1 Tax=Platanthera guangdongensis TaxID=2320717 RepID=A0ABR2M285_9ASPA